LLRTIGIVYELAVGGALAVWVFATVAIQLPRLRPWLRSRDFCLLVPEYRFFAPRPAQGDFHLLFRDTYINGTVSQWTEVCPPGCRYRRHALWHPYKRQRKALFDSVNSVMELRTQNENAGGRMLLEVTTPYLNLLNHVANLPRSPQPELTQFMILQSYGWWSSQESTVLFLSKNHRLTLTRTAVPPYEAMHTQKI
jgi:hypothetical protein